MVGRRAVRRELGASVAVGETTPLQSWSEIVTTGGYSQSPQGAELDRLREVVAAQQRVIAVLEEALREIVRSDPPSSWEREENVALAARVETAEKERDEALHAENVEAEYREAAEARVAVLREVIASAMTSLATGPRDGYAYSVLDAALQETEAAKEETANEP